MMKRLPAFYFLVLGFLSSVNAAERIATYNVRTDSKVDRAAGDAWEKRLPRIVEVVRGHAFEVFATQEAQPHQAKGLRDALSEYAYWGVGRDDGKDAGEHVGMFYLADQYERLDQGHFWLSPTPEVAGKGWDAALPRVCAWMKLKHLKTGIERYYFALHFDHRGEQAKVESAKLVMQRAKAMAKGQSVVIFGDFNFTEHEPGYALMAKEPVFVDSFEVAKQRYAPTGTFNGFDADHVLTTKIDHVFVDRSTRVKRYFIVTDGYSDAVAESVEVGPPYRPDPQERQRTKFRFPSDHFPVVADLE